MLMMSMPDVPPQQAPVIVMAQAAQPSKDGLYGSMGVCLVSPTLAKIGIGTDSASPNGLSLYPQGEALRRLPEDFGANLLMVLDNASVQILQQPTHGVIVSKDNDSFYVPNQGYVGNDKVVFFVNIVNIDGRIVKTVYYLKVVDAEVTSKNFDELYNKYCPRRSDWQISFNTIGGNSLVNNLTQSWVNFAQPNVTVTFGAITGAAVGQTTGTNITLDTNAAGYNWFIDNTPSQNEEWLPTSNPNEWVAKAGSAAAGKMDMLSVLLHEYGHALGIDHSANGHDYMATTLTAGVRRLPSADELALMQQLIGQAKDGLARSNTQDNVPFPTLPLGGMSLAFAGLLRGSRYGGLSISPVPGTLVTEYATAANATFTNLDAATGWNTKGGVDIVPASTGSTLTASATLNEVSGSQTRLNQVFMLNDKDRYLSFTLSGTVLETNW